MGLEVDVPSLRAQEARSAMVALDPVRITRSASGGSGEPGGTMVSATDGSSFRGIEVVEIGDPGQDRRRDLQRRVGLRLDEREVDGILRRQLVGVPEPRHHAERRPAGKPQDRRKAFVEEANVAAELVDQKRPNEAAVRLVEDRSGADEAGDDAAPVDIADEDHRHAGGPGEAHIGDVAVAQIGLRRAAGALDHDEVRLAPSRRKLSSTKGRRSARALPERGRFELSETLALDDDLRAAIASRASRGPGSCGRSQQPGRRGPGAPARGRSRRPRRRGVVRHVLRLERADTQPPPREKTAESRDEEGLADIRAGALDHDGGGARHASVS